MPQDFLKNGMSPIKYYSMMLNAIAYYHTWNSNDFQTTVLLGILSGTQARWYVFYVTYWMPVCTETRAASRDQQEIWSWWRPWGSKPQPVVWIQGLEKSLPTWAAFTFLLWQHSAYSPIGCQGHSEQLRLPGHPAVQRFGMLGGRWDCPEHPWHRIGLQAEWHCGGMVNTAWDREGILGTL